MNNDLISRKWLTDAIRNRRTYLSYEDAKDVIDLIDNAPTVELDESVIQEVLNKRCMTVITNEYLISLIKSNCKRPQGEWGKHGECPFCSYVRQWEDDKFCGNCGAKLRKGGAE